MYRDDGWIPEEDSPKNWGYEDRLKPVYAAVPESGDVDLRPFTSPRHDQGPTGSCSANAVVKAFEIKRIQKYGYGAHTDLSRMAVYYLARELTFPPKTHVDKGVNIGLAFDVLRRFGVCPEADWPFDPSKVNLPPSWKAMRSAYLHKIGAYYRIRSTGPERVAEVLHCLRAGNPVVFGTRTGSNWHEYKAGEVLTVPVNPTGRHATVLVGYKDGVFLGENSWGPNWGENGFYLMSPEVIASDKSQDFWVAQAPWEVTP